MFDINDYTRSAKEIAVAATELQAATAEVSKLVETALPAVESTGAEVGTLATHIALLVGVLIVVLFAVALVYKVAVARLVHKK